MIGNFGPHSLWRWRWAMTCPLAWSFWHSIACRARRCPAVLALSISNARPLRHSTALTFLSLSCLLFVCLLGPIESASSDRDPWLRPLDSNPSVPCARLLWHFVSPPLLPLAHSVSSSVMPGDHATSALSGAQLSASPVPACPRLLLRLETLVAPALTRLLCSAALA